MLFRSVKSASLVMKPLIDSLTTISADIFYSKLSGIKIKDRKTNSNPILEPKLHSNIGQLKNQSILIEGSTIKISPLLEVIRINPNSEFQIQLPYPIYVAEINTDFGSQDIYSWLECELIDENGNKQVLRNNDGSYFINNKITSLSFKSRADKRMEFNLRKLELSTALNIGTKDDITPVFDKNLASSYCLGANQTISFQTPLNCSIIIVTEKNANLTVNQFHLQKPIETTYLTENKSIHILGLNNNTNNISLTNMSNNPINIAEIIFNQE